MLGNRHFAAGLFVLVFCCAPLEAGPVHDAARAGEMETVRALIEKEPVLVRARDDEGRTPLHWACLSKNEALAAYLVDKGADIHARDALEHAPLHAAAYGNLVKTAAILLQRGANIDSLNYENLTPLHVAAGNDHKEMVAFLVEKGAALERKGNYGRTPLIRGARERGGPEVIARLLEGGADVNAQDRSGSTALELAAWRGKKDVVNVLLDAGATVPTQGPKAAQLAAHAASHGLSRLFEKLANGGADLSAKTSSAGTLLHQAAGGDSLTIVKGLLDRGLDPKLADRYGWTPLHYAALNGRARVASLLLENGADINVRTTMGQTPFNVAAEFKHHEVEELLVSRGAGQEAPVLPLLKGPYLGQKPPGRTPEIFALGIVSSIWGLHSAVAFSPDGKSAAWAPMIELPGSIYSQGGIHMMHRAKGRWTFPEAASFSGDHNDDVPFFAPDGKRLYFISTRALPGLEGSGKERIWFADRKGRGWSEPVPLDPVVNRKQMHWQFSVDGKRNLYFSSNAPGGAGRNDIYLAACVGGRYLEPEVLGPGVNTAADEATPFVAPDGSYLLFNRDLDLFVSFRTPDGGWSQARSLGFRINTPAYELCPMVTPDGKYLFFLSTRGGESHPYWVDAGIIEQVRTAAYADISEALAQTIDAKGSEAAIELYRRLKAESPELYDFRESMLNSLGYRLLGQRRYKAAIAMFSLNVDAYPQSANVYDSLGEGLMKDGSYERAAAQYRKALELDPSSRNAAQMLEKLEVKMTDTAGSKHLVFRKSRQRFHPDNTVQIALGDLDGDGDLDAVCANMGSSPSQVWLNDGSGLLVAGQALTLQGHGVGLEDLDGDRDLDIFIPCASFGPSGAQSHLPSRIYFNDGNGAFSESGQDLGDGAWSGTAVDLTDLDGDGDFDAVVSYYGRDRACYMNDGKGLFSGSDRTFANSSYFADLDSDGDRDVFVKVDGKGYQVLRNDGRGTLEEAGFLEDPEAMVLFGDVAFADMDGDGDLDALLANGDRRNAAHPAKLLLNDGAGRFTDSGQRLSAFNNAGITLGDLNNDGYPDAVITDWERPNQVWWNDGSGTLSDSELRIGNLEMFTHAALGDLDGDGDLDLFFAGFGTQGGTEANEIWFNEGK